jgi:hypothetical protein
VAPRLENDEGSGRLLDIRIERWGEVRFSGLLALRPDGSGLYYALLDATGVKLLEAVTAEDSGYRLIHGKGALRESGLGEFLAEVLTRIYLQGPAVPPCSGSWLYRVCRDQEADGAWQKYGQAGFLEIWRAKSAPDQKSAIGAVIYRQPWLGIRIVLQSMHPAP